VLRIKGIIETLKCQSAASRPVIKCMSKQFVLVKPLRLKSHISTQVKFMVPTCQP